MPLDVSQRPRVAPDPTTLGRGSATPGTAVPVGIFGASGTSGVELARVLVDHPGFQLAFATSRGERGRSLDEIDPAGPSLALEHPDDVALDRVELAFLCVPHGTAGPLAQRCIESGARVVDLSGDHRLRAPEAHADTYGSERSEALASEAVYGLTELARERVAAARLVANPGCYATAAILPLAALARAGRLDDLPVVDAKSGVSGAGRVPTATNHFCSVAGDVRPYKVGRAHRHVREIEQELTNASASDAPSRVVFNPHLVPLERGIEATIVLRGCTARAAREALSATYRDEPFVRLLPEGQTARIRAVVGTNRADVGVAAVAGTDACVLTVAIDNLQKGAAGQAVQNANVMCGWSETTGLRS